MENEFIYRFYSNPNFPNRTTVVGKFTDNKLKLAVSRCSNNDNFSKVVGRELAEKRLKEDNCIAIFPMKECSIKKFRKIAEHMFVLTLVNPDFIESNKESVQNVNPA